MKSPIISNYSIDQETIDSILELENCPILTTFWQNLLNYTNFDVTFGENKTNKTLKLQYNYGDINISVYAQKVDLVAIKVLYRNEQISLEDQTLDKDIKIKLAHILREFLEIIKIFVDTNERAKLEDGSNTAPLCTLACNVNAIRT
jgi:hypothetical protein